MRSERDNILSLRYITSRIRRRGRRARVFLEDIVTCDRCHRIQGLKFTRKTQVQFKDALRVHTAALR